MVFFLASVTDEDAKRVASKLRYKNVLLSFAGPPGAWELNRDIIFDPDARLMVDPGSYIARTKGWKIDLGRYAEFCLRLISVARCQLDFISLDKIPGRPEEAEDSARENWETLKGLRGRGVPAMPVFHQFEGLEWLVRMLDSYDYIGVSPSKLKTVSDDERFRWVAEVFAVIRARGVLPRTHASGVADDRLLTNFPFYSADSTTWLSGEAHRKYLVWGRHPTRALDSLWRGEVLHSVPLSRLDPHGDRAEDDGRRFPAAEAERFAKEASYRFRVGIEAFARYQEWLTYFWKHKGGVGDLEQWSSDRTWWLGPVDWGDD